MGTSRHKPGRTGADAVGHGFRPRVNIELRILGRHVAVCIRADSKLPSTGATGVARSFYYYVPISPGDMFDKGPVGLAADVLAQCYATYYADLSAGFDPERSAAQRREAGAPMLNTDLQRE